MLCGKYCSEELLSIEFLSTAPKNRKNMLCGNSFS
jgi:hypothetical protein